MRRFLRLYSFLSQIIDWQDIELEKLYAYARHLLAKLPYRNREGMLTLDDEVDLYAYRNEKTFAGRLEIGDWRLQIGDWRLEIASQKSEVRSQKSEVRSQKSEFDAVAN